MVVPDFDEKITRVWANSLGIKSIICCGSVESIIGKEELNFLDMTSAANEEPPIPQRINSLIPLLLAQAASASHCGSSCLLAFGRSTQSIRLIASSFDCHKDESFDAILGKSLFSSATTDSLFLASAGPFTIIVSFQLLVR